MGGNLRELKASINRSGNSATTYFWRSSQQKSKPLLHHRIIAIVWNYPRCLLPSFATSLLQKDWYKFSPFIMRFYGFEEIPKVSGFSVEF